MGAGFQLVETKSVTGMSILFGSAWWIDGQAPGVLREMIFSTLLGRRMDGARALA